ncbi:MAG: YeiH family protein [Tissierella sp.]|uniref:YeiH family protein n=1 Tax=Tissierella sp. TaxID=41274 RepID=UPI003F947844
MNLTKRYTPGIILTILLSLLAIYISSFIPKGLISPGVFSLLIGMVLNPFTSKYTILKKGVKFTSKGVLKIAIILMGATLSFTQVLQVGKYSLFVMMFTLATAFGGGYYLGKLFNINWKLSSLISAGTGICGGSAIAAIAPTIEAETKDIAYSISATFLFDIIMVVLFPLAGKYFGMSDLGFGLWAGTAVNDTSSVVAAGYAFSDAAGNFSLIVKLTRTLSIVPVVLIFSYINERIKDKKNIKAGNIKSQEKINIKKIFPWFIILFLGIVGIRSMGFISDGLSANISSLSKFSMIMALGAIGLNTNFKEVSKSGFLPMVHGFLISLLVVLVSFGVQMMMGQI